MEEHQTDTHAIARLKNGDLSGLDALMAQYQLRAVRAAYLIVRDRATAEEIVQEAFVALPHKIRRFEDGRPFQPWFMRWVINDAIKVSQRNQRLVSLNGDVVDEESTLLDALMDPNPGPEVQVMQAEADRMVWHALETLPPQERAVVVMRYYLGYSEAEMSAELGRPAGTVKWLLHMARRRLRVLLSAFVPSPRQGKEDER
jgi:RNA polymerase sigma-70 factor (ECF subfamily)